MNPTALYSKSGKGVQEASGKTSQLSRGDRAVLSAFDGKLTASEVAARVGKPFDGKFEQLIRQLEKDGFIREVSPGAAPAARPGAAAKPAAGRAAGGGAGAAPGPDLDFTIAIPASPPPKPKGPAAPPPVDPATKARAETERKAQEDNMARARRDAEEKAQKERDRVKAEAEAKLRAETEAKLRAEAEQKGKAEAEHKGKAEAEAKLRAEAEAKAKAAREAAVRIAAEAKAKAEAEMQAKLEAERARAREEAEKARREAEERKRREEEARRAQEKKERQAREDGERQAREAAERLVQEEAERAEREAKKEKEKPKEKEKAPAGGGFDSLMADLDSFGEREEEEKKKEEAERREKDEKKARQAREQAERKAKEEAEEARKEAEEKARKEEEERAKREAEERRAREAAAAKQEKSKAQAKSSDDIGVTDDDLDMDDVKRDQEAVSAESRKAVREREREAKEREREARERAKEREREAKRAAGAPAAAATYKPFRRKRSWGKPVALTLFVLLVAGVGAIHVMPVSTAEYEKAAGEAIGRPVKIGAGRLSLYSGAQFKFENVSVGDVKIAAVRAYPEVGALFGDKKAFSRIELDGVSLPQQALGELFAARIKGANFSVGRLSVRQLKLSGPLALPVLEADMDITPSGAVGVTSLRGPDDLAAKLTPTGSAIDFDVTAAGFTLPFLPDVTLATFAMKGKATSASMKIESWGGASLDGAVSGNANVRWGRSWSLDGAMTVRGINAAVFAPALLSEGKAEGSGRFSMNDPDPANFMGRGRIEGTFSVNKGVLGSFDLSRAIQTGGRQATGRTPFTEMSGQVVFDKGAVALRNVNFRAGAMNAGASADVTPDGALSGRIVADIRTSSQNLRATVNIGGTVKEPQVK